MAVRLNWRLAAYCMVVLLAACAHKAPKDNADASSVRADNPAAPDYQIKETEVASEAVEENVEKPYKSPMGEIALDDNPAVEKWIHYFQNKGRKYMRLYLSRSTRYLPMMKNVLRENGLPEDLVYVSLIESGFSPQAHSRSNAVGYWQFIRSTGRRYGLHIDGFIDERRDPVLATRAAAEYFKELYSLFGSWHLALAAYNAGENRVKRAVMKHYTRDFWALMKKRRALASETKQYVPKFIAAVKIAKEPEKYGFTGLDFDDPLSYDTVALNHPISMTKLAQNLDVDVDELKLLNPKFRGDFVPLSRNDETIVRIPVGKGTDAVAAVSLSTSKEPKIVQSDIYYYRIRRGDNLSMIAKQRHTTVSRLRRLNNLSNRTLLRVGMRIRVPDSGGEGYHYVSDADDTKGKRRSAASVEEAVATQDDGSSTSTGIEGDYHIIRRGENLSTISKRFGVTIRQLLKMNNITRKTVLRAGQKIRVRVDTSERSAVTKKTHHTIRVAKHGAVRLATKHMAARTIRHRIVRGETLTSIAAHYKVSLQNLARANKLKAGNKILVGDNLIIPAKLME
jgi:membrane-bound lytic murein transglycosylase D